VLVVDRGGRTGEVEDRVDFQAYRLRDVVPQKLEALIVQQVADVLLGPCEEVVEADHVVAVGQEPLAEVRAYESSSASDQNRLAAFAHLRTPP